ARVPGAAHGRKRRAGRARRRPRLGARGAGAGRPPRGALLPFRRGPPRAAVPRARVARLHLPAAAPRVRLRPQAAHAPARTRARAAARRGAPQPARAQRAPARRRSVLNTRLRKSGPWFYGLLALALGAIAACGVLVYVRTQLTSL